ncbi:Uncharacterised protein [[Clostridium] sordellii]|uniref:hypothetical protein n=2 Tax=Paraclostridium sordellii TaxID=1505 RepID=UPI0005DDFF0C|nr:hypothetical protein [Paeniclostridium sordellii]CEP41274.1 Uncharacterised protein [[Clostridium] sordellii] [Paeniclostridium sordellii]
MLEIYKIFLEGDYIMNYCLNVKESLESNLVELNHDDLTELNGGGFGDRALTGVKIVVGVTTVIATTAFALGFGDGLRGK